VGRGGGSVEVLRPSEKQSRLAYFASLSDEKLLLTAVDYVWLCQRDDPPWPQFAWSRDVCLGPNARTAANRNCSLKRSIAASR
jgi:hypothetical protein